MDHQNLEIELSRCFCGAAEVRFLESPVDRPREPLDLNDDRLQRLWRRVGRFEELIGDGSTQALGQRRHLAEAIGRELFDLLTPGRVGGALREVLMLMDERRLSLETGIRIRLSFGDSKHFEPDLANLPWELLFDPLGGGRFIAGEAPIQILRYLDLGRKTVLSPVPPPLRVLAVLSSPRSQSLLDLDDQELMLRRAIGEHPTRIELFRLEPPTLDALLETLDKHSRQGEPFHVIHFLGHGELTDSGHGALYFEGRNQSERIVRGEDLARALSPFRDLRLAVLSTCFGARLPRRAGQSPFTGSASALVAGNLASVVAMQFTTMETAAIAFSSGFYSRLARGGSLVEAVAEGRLHIDRSCPETLEWATPVLFLRSPDVALLDLEGSTERGPSVAPERTVTQIRTGPLRSRRDVSIRALRRSSRSPRAGAESSVSIDRIDSEGDVTITGIDEP